MSTGTAAGGYGSGRRGNARVALVVVLAAFAVLRLVALTRYPLWTDETWTLDSTGADLRRMLRAFADDQTHPPLFYLALWVWRRIVPETLAWLRLLPCLIGIATGGTLLALARRAHFTARAAALAVILGAGSGILVAYSAELRSYALLALLGVVSLTAWLRTREGTGREGLTVLTAVNILLVWTHYFGAFIIAAEWCDAALRKRSRLVAMTMSAAISVASLAPWAAYVAHRAGITGTRLEMVAWLKPPRAADLLDVPLAAIGGSPWLALDLVVVVAAGAAVALWAWRSRHAREAPAIGLLALAVLVPCAIAYVESVLGPKAMWLDRYLIATAPPMLLLVAGAVDGLAPCTTRGTALAAAVALVPAGFTATSLERGRERPRFDLVWATAAARDPDPRVPVLAGDATEGRPLLYISRMSGAGRRPVTVVPPGDVRADSGWYVWSEAHPPTGWPPPAVFIRDGYRITETIGIPAARDSIAAVRFARPR
ncbi:MAG: hypothetical protein U9Q74_07265 [Gemmatimonadota bacterium]|nr:hypothetical protein [Gemmatimonadota bacterium]